jgi:hypothetical protein
VRAALVLCLLSGAALAQESLIGPQYRAYTLDPKERKLVPVPGLERVTGASGMCIEEELIEFSSLTLVATCAGVRTTLAWLKDGARMHFMACAEGDDRPPELVTRRKKVQAELKGIKGVTACVRAKRIELLGWALDKKERATVAKIAKKHGVDDHVEEIGAEY